VDFTREPIIETVITPKEGCKIVVRSSKSIGQEEYFVDAVEVVSFGSSFFFRSLERPKAFLVPASDYEILEVRETRMVLKSVGMDRSIKIGGGKEQSNKPPRENLADREKIVEPAAEETSEPKTDEPTTAIRGEARLDKKRDRRRHYRRKRGKEDGAPKDEQSSDEKEEGQETERKEEKRIALVAPLDLGEEGENLSATSSGSQGTSLFSSLLAPPPTLISETIALYKENELFKNVFFSPKKDQREDDLEASSEEKIPLEAPESDRKTSHAEEDEFERDPFRDLEQLEITLPSLDEDMEEDFGIYPEKESIDVSQELDVGQELEPEETPSNELFEFETVHEDSFLKEPEEEAAVEKEAEEGSEIGQTPEEENEAPEDSHSSTSTDNHTSH
jgi:hypothetical protein